MDWQRCEHHQFDMHKKFKKLMFLPFFACVFPLWWLHCLFLGPPLGSRGQAPSYNHTRTFIPCLYVLCSRRLWLASSTLLQASVIWEGRMQNKAGGKQRSYSHWLRDVATAQTFEYTGETYAFTSHSSKQPEGGQTLTMLVGTSILALHGQCLRRLQKDWQWSARY